MIGRQRLRERIANRRAMLHLFFSFIWPRISPDDSPRESGPKGARGWFVTPRHINKRYTLPNGDTDARSWISLLTCNLYYFLGKVCAYCLSKVRCGVLATSSSSISLDRTVIVYLTLLQVLVFLRLSFLAASLSHSGPWIDKSKNDWLVVTTLNHPIVVTSRP